MISDEEKGIILDIIKRNIPLCDVLLFGSRYKGTNRAASDVDLAIVSPELLSIFELATLKEDFMNSDLPMRADIVEYNAVSDSFKKCIDEGNIKIYNGREK